MHSKLDTKNMALIMSNAVYSFLMDVVKDSDNLNLEFSK